MNMKKILINFSVVSFLIVNIVDCSENLGQQLADYITQITAATTKINTFLQDQLRAKSDLERKIKQSRSDLKDRMNEIGLSQKEAAALADQLKKFRESAIGPLVDRFQWRYDALKELNMAKNSLDKRKEIAARLRTVYARMQKESSDATEQKSLGSLISALTPK